MRKVLTYFALLAPVVSLAALTPDRNENTVDINRDGTVNAADVAAIASYITGRKTDIDLTAADINRDSKVDITDLALLIGLLKEAKFKYADSEIIQTSGGQGGPPLSRSQEK